MQLAQADKIWLPGGAAVDRAQLRVHMALQTYDERLMFGRNEDTGDYCAFVKMPHGQRPIPVIGFGKTVPTPEDAVRRCDAANTRRHGSQILEAMNAENAEIRARQEKEGEQLAEEMAELMESGIHRQGAGVRRRVYMHTPERDKVARGYN